MATLDGGGNQLVYGGKLSARYMYSGERPFSALCHYCNDMVALLLQVYVVNDCGLCLHGPSVQPMCNNLPSPSVRLAGGGGG